MFRPVLIDTDMGVDDAVAIALALSSSEIQVAGLVSVAGNVSIEQATANIGRLLGGLVPESLPQVARGLGQRVSQLRDATHVFGEDGLGGIELAVPPDFAPGEFLELYERLAEQHGHSLTVLALGPLTNLAAVLQEKPEVLAKVGQIVVMGGAIWCPGNVTRWAEFNFYRDPAAAAAVLSAGLPLTVVPLDVTRQVAMDESHTAHLSRGGTRAGDLLGRMIRLPMERETADALPGSFVVHDAVAMGVLLWPKLFMRSRMGLEVIVSGEQAGRCKPVVVKDKSRQIGVVISVNVGEFMENMLEQLSQEKFVV
ncbi:MAG TPA: nucleoside hydrolase [Phycisphaerae bacterium]|nr:nucleoside hydrolase [Phycisphaerae bacterium]